MGDAGGQVTYDVHLLRLAELLLERTPERHVAADGAQAQRLARRRVEDEKRRRLDVDPLAGRQVNELPLPFPVPLVEDGGQLDLQGLLDALGREQIADSHGPRFLEVAKPHHSQASVVDEEDAPVDRADADEVGRSLHDERVEVALLVGAPPFRDVEHDTRQTHDLPPLVAERPTGSVQPALAAVQLHDTMLDVVIATSREHPTDSLGDPGAILGMDMLEEGVVGAAERARSHAVERLDGRGPAHLAGDEVPVPYAHASRDERRRQPLLTVHRLALFS